MSLCLAAALGLGSGLGVLPAVALAVAAAAVAAGSSYLIEWTTLGRAYVEVRDGGNDVVQNRLRRWTGTLSGPLMIAPLDGTWSTPGVRMVMADSSGRGGTPVSALALDPEQDLEALADLIKVTVASAPDRRVSAPPGLLLGPPRWRHRRARDLGGRRFGHPRR